MIVGRKGDTVIPQEAQLVGKLDDDQSTSKTFRQNIVLEHDPAILCENKNIHTDYKEHFIHRQDNNNGTNYKEEVKQFIEKAHKYLLEGKFNRNFKLKDYCKSSIFGSLTKIELKPINEEYMQV